MVMGPEAESDQERDMDRWLNELWFMVYIEVVFIGFRNVLITGGTSLWRSFPIYYGIIFELLIKQPGF